MESDMTKNGALAIVVKDVVQTLLSNKARRATKYIDSKLVVSAARVLFNGKIDRRDTRTTIVLKIGAPNYQEREFIKMCRKADEPFPVERVQLKLI